MVSTLSSICGPFVLKTTNIHILILSSWLSHLQVTFVGKILKFQSFFFSSFIQVPLWVYLSMFLINCFDGDHSSVNFTLYLVMYLEQVVLIDCQHTRFQCVCLSVCLCIFVNHKLQNPTYIIYYVIRNSSTLGVPGARPLLGFPKVCIQIRIRQ